MSRLDGIIETTRQDVENRRKQLPESELRSRLGSHRDDRPFAEALSRPGMSLIAEHKRRSPSAGAIREDLSLEQVVKSYEAGGFAIHKEARIIEKFHYRNFINKKFIRLDQTSTEDRIKSL